MGCLSLRGVISGLSSTFVAIVAIITLSITLTTSLSALRNIGKSHASSLLANANLKTTQLFDEPAIVVDALRNTSMSQRWPLPSDDPDTFEYFAQLHRTLYLTTELQSAGIVTYFADNVRLGVGPLEGYNYLYREEDFLPGAYSSGGIAYQRTQPIQEFVSLYYVSNHSTPPATDPGWSAPRYQAVLIRDTTLWNSSFVVGSLNGQSPVYAGVYLVAFANTSKNYVPVLAPLYVKGSAKGANNVYGFTVALLYTAGISGFLSSVGGTPNTQSFAYDGAGYLIGSSYSAAFEVETTVAPNTKAPLGCATTDATAGVSLSDNVYMSCRTHASVYPFSPLQAVASDDNLLFAKDTVQLLTIGSDVWYAAVARVPLRYPGMTLQLALLLPEADVIGDVVQGRNLAIGITCAVYVVVAVLSFVLISLLLRPLTSVSERMILAAALEDDTAERDVSAMAEVQSLQEAYYAMNDELNRIKSFVPQSVLEAHRSGSDDEVEAEMAALRADREGLTRSKSLGIDDGATASSRHSRLSSSQSVLSRRTTTTGVNVHGLNTKTSLVLQNITVLAMNLSGFTQTSIERSRDDVMKAVADVVSAVAAEVRNNNGVLHSFHGDHFVATYNAVRGCGSHARLASVTGMKLCKHIQTIGLGLKLRAGVSTGKCLVGNLGSNDMKGFNTIGPAFMQAAILERMTRLYGVGCRILAVKRTCLDISTHVRFRYVDLVLLPGAAKPGLIGALTGECNASNAHRVNDGNDAEWLYVIGRNVDADALHNEAFSALESGHVQEAQRIVAQSPGNASVSATTDTASTSSQFDVNVGLTADEVIESRMVNDMFFELCEAAVSSGVETPYTSMGRFFDGAFLMASCKPRAP